ncbi:MAG: CoA pyrophosphatase [Pseudomonadota bacterium]
MNAAPDAKIALPEPAPKPRFHAADVLRRAERLKRLGEDVLRQEPDSGDFLLNPDIAVSLKSRSARDAAVLVPIVSREPEATVLLTRRTDHLPSHAGQIAFPGGKIDPDDTGPVAASLREANEEIGLTSDNVDVLGFGDTYVTGSGYRIVPVVGLVRPDPDLTVNRDEVAAIFEVPLSFLMDARNHHQGRRTWQGRERKFYVMPYYEHYIWGVTAGIVRTLYERMYES